MTALTSRPGPLPPITDLSLTALGEMLQGRGERAFRSAQIAGWLYRSKADSFAAMHNVPKSLREALATQYAFSAAVPVAQRVSADERTIKAVLRLRDGALIESVLMRYDRRRDGTGRQRATVCVSSQVGCPLRCSFCATGLMGLARNLTAAEMVDQVLHFLRWSRHHPPVVRNVVFMGMGEPCLNLDSCMEAVDRLCDPLGACLAAPRITISTVGWVPGIERLARESWPVRLAVSLHAPNNDLRDQLVPLNRRYPLDALLASCRAYQQQTGRRVTIEYTLMDGVNDSAPLARELIRVLHGLDCHINLIPMNPVADLPYEPSPQPAVAAFHAILRAGGLVATVRQQMGRDIRGACGQLQTEVSSPKAGQ